MSPELSDTVLGVTVPEGHAHSVTSRASRSATVLIVDDEELIRLSLRHRFELAGYEVVEAADGRAALAEFGDGVDLVLLDYRLPDKDGLTLLAEMKAEDPDVPVVLLTAFSSVERAVDAMRHGAFHFISKPFDPDEVLAISERALETTALRREVRRLRARQGNGSSLEAIIGESTEMREVKSLLEKFAASRDATILLTGESGTGKDLAARAIHGASPRAHGPFLNITCSALPESLLESELFGHERGAFTDARQQRKGLLEQADTGTVFLDEIGEMTPALQAKLLRFLEEHTFRRVGGSAEIRPDVRVVAATNRDLAAMVEDGSFREDLYYRLTVLHVHLPPLRERREDIAPLARLFVARFNSELCKNVRKLSAKVLAELSAYPWPGNVRELRNAIERAVLLAESDVLGPDDFSSMRRSTRPRASSCLDLPAEGIDLAELEQRFVRQALERTGGNQSRAARLLGMNRDQIRYRIEKFDLRDVLPER
jgi:DNA-binding NtrC family response regulator